MSREFKFRAWDEQAKSWIGNFWHSIERDEEFHIAFTDAEGLVIEQYTGLKDGNGKEIYEGDIVKIYEYDANTGVDKYSHTTQVVWVQRYAQFTTTSSDTLSGEKTYDFWEVIGNVHENPELLKYNMTI